MQISAILALLVIGAVLGCVLGIANQYLRVEEDNRISDVTEMLPGANCGGCGYPGCAGFAGALVEGEASKVSACVVSNQETFQFKCFIWKLTMKCQFPFFIFLF